MSSQETSITHSALGWVKKSIDDTLSETSTDLRRYIEEGDEALLESARQRGPVMRETKRFTARTSVYPYKGYGLD